MTNYEKMAGAFALVAVGLAYDGLNAEISMTNEKASYVFRGMTVSGEIKNISFKSLPKMLFFFPDGTEDSRQIEESVTDIIITLMQIRRHAVKNGQDVLVSAEISVETNFGLEIQVISDAETLMYENVSLEGRALEELAEKLDELSEELWNATHKV